MQLQSGTTCKTLARNATSYLGGWNVLAFCEQNSTRRVQDLGPSIIRQFDRLKGGEPMQPWLGTTFEMLMNAKKKYLN